MLTPLAALTVGAALLGFALTTTAVAHVFVFSTERSGAAFRIPGEGWRTEGFLNIPPESADNLVTAQRFTVGRAPDVTFRTDWIDFPSGPLGAMPDSKINTLADFLGDAVFDVSDRKALRRHPGDFLLRFSGHIRVETADSWEIPQQAPVLLEFGVFGLDGYSIKLGGDSIRRLLSDPACPFSNDFFIVEVVGVYPIIVDYFNRDIPEGSFGNPCTGCAGMELYSWHGSDRVWPGGSELISSLFGPASIVPPHRIIPAGEVVETGIGDADADRDVDLQDWQMFQNCFTGDGEEKGGFNLIPGCDSFDFTADRDVDLFDFSTLDAVLSGPNS